MRLILTEYINSLKEDGELDKVVQDILRAYQIEIFSKPERGRQYGVDIYAVGRDFEDHNKKKVFLITVKQGDLDRQTWNVHQNSVMQSLDEIRDVFIRSNLAPQHKKLPIKIVVAFNGMLKQSVQQNWRGYAESNLKYEYALWEIDFLVNHFQDKLLNEQSFSNEVRSLIRKTIIHLEDPNYELLDYSLLLDNLIQQFKIASSKKAKLKCFKELHLIVAIITKYCKESNNLKHAIKCVEKYLLRLWEIVKDYENDKDYIIAFISAYDIHLKSMLEYYQKMGFVAHVLDGYGRMATNSLTYTYTVYEQVGILSMTGLVILQMHEMISSLEKIKDLADGMKMKVLEISNSVIAAFNNNSILYSPREDSQHIEICLVFILLFKLGKKQDIKTLLHQFNNQIGEGLMFLNIFPTFYDNKREIAELDVDYDKRSTYEYEASNLLTVLIEWVAVVDDEGLYQLYKTLKDNLLPEANLMLWFPEKNTEQILYAKYASTETGYDLSGITLPDNLKSFQNIISEEFTNNCFEKEFSFFKQGTWIMGLIASRHYRTYVFPYYWRQFLGIEIPELSIV